MGYLIYTVDGPEVPITCGATALAQGVFVKVASGLAVICGANDDVNVIGVTTKPCAVGESANIRLFNGGGILKVACGEAIDLCDVIYVGASGTAVDTDPGSKEGIGIALNATVTAGDEVAFIVKNAFTDT